jgi:DNA-binding response OmpR family regulator
MAHILLIEPTQILADVCQKALMAAGHTVVWRQTAEQGVAALDEHKIDIIVLEIQIPIHNGIEFLYEMRSYSDWADIPVVLYTDIRQSAEFDSALSQLKVGKWLYKPQTSLTTLTQAVAAATKKI